MLDALIYAEEADSRRYLATLLTSKDLKVKVAEHFSEIVGPCLERKCRMVIFVLGPGGVPEEVERFQVLRILQQIDADLPVVVICDEEGLEMERELRSAGIFYFLSRPFSGDELLGAVRCAIEKSQRQSMT